MNDGRLAKLRAQIRPRWDEDRTARVREALERRSRRWRFARAGLALVAVGSLAAVVALVVHAREKERHRVDVAQTTTATPLGRDSVLMPDPGGAGRAFVLKRGAARFVVAHDPTHPFLVRAGAVLVEDVGTAFTVRLVSTAVVEVAVDEGRVRVVDPSRTSELGPGERRTFDAEVPSPEAPGDAGAVPSAPLASGEGPVWTLAPHPISVPPWRPLAEGGQYREAFESLRRAGRFAVRDDAGELLLAADAARLSGHPGDAVPYLEQVARSHGRDPRVGLAYFTLGRVLLDELGRPAEAASAFENARRGELAEDALAREVEACSRAGDMIRASNLALEYERLYPHGRRARAVAKFGGLE